MYKHIWEAEDGETLNCVRETTNRRDPFSVGVIKDAVVIGHLARKISTVSSLFLKQKGTITCSAWKKILKRLTARRTRND